MNCFNVHWSHLANIQFLVLGLRLDPDFFPLMLIGSSFPHFLISLFPGDVCSCSEAESGVAVPGWPLMFCSWPLLALGLWGCSQSGDVLSSSGPSWCSNALERNLKVFEGKGKQTPLIKVTERFLNGCVFQHHFCPVCSQFSQLPPAQSQSLPVLSQSESSMIPVSAHWAPVTQTCPQLPQHGPSFPPAHSQSLPVRSQSPPLWSQTLPVYPSYPEQSRSHSQHSQLPQRGSLAPSFISVPPTTVPVPLSIDLGFFGWGGECLENAELQS